MKLIIEIILLVFIIATFASFMTKYVSMEKVSWKDYFKHLGIAYITTGLVALAVFILYHFIINH